MKKIYSIVSKLQDSIYELSDDEQIIAMVFIEKYLESTKECIKRKAYNRVLNRKY